MTNPLIYDIIVVSKGMNPLKEGYGNMRKVKWYRYTFEDGCISIVRGYSKHELAVEVHKHGRLISKVFEGWG